MAQEQSYQLITLDVIHLLNIQMPATFNLDFDSDLCILTLIHPEKYCLKLKVFSKWKDICIENMNVVTDAQSKNGKNC